MIKLLFGVYGISILSWIFNRKAMDDKILNWLEKAVAINLFSVLTTFVFWLFLSGLMEL